jgi:hypothetical protein
MPWLDRQGWGVPGVSRPAIAKAGLMSYFAIHRLSFLFMPYGEPKSLLEMTRL